MLIDTHAHLNDERLKDKVEEIVNTLEENNIEKVINAGCDTPSSIYNAELASKYKQLYATVGIHPHDAKLATKEDYDIFAKLVKENNKVVAVGEIGLDYHYDLSPRDVQQRVLVEQIDLANELKMPIVFHLREAYDDMIKILNENKHKLKNGCVLHCYSGSRELVRQVFDKFDFYYSFGGAITFARKKDKVIKVVPKDRLLLETDCPYMTPVPFRGKTNEPKRVNIVAQKIAEFLNTEYEEIEEITTKNAYTLFKRLNN